MEEVDEAGLVVASDCEQSINATESGFTEVQESIDTVHEAVPSIFCQCNCD